MWEDWDDVEDGDEDDDERGDEDFGVSIEDGKTVGRPSGEGEGVASAEES